MPAPRMARNGPDAGIVLAGAGAGRGTVDPSVGAMGWWRGTDPAAPPSDIMKSRPPRCKLSGHPNPGGAYANRNGPPRSSRDRPRAVHGDRDGGGEVEGRVHMWRRATTA